MRERKLDVLRGHCADVGRNYDDIKKTVMMAIDPGPDGEKVDALLEELQRLSALGITHVHGSLPNVSQITPIDLLAERVIPAAAEL